MKPASGSEIPTVLRCLFEEHRHLGALTDLLREKASKPGRLSPGDAYLLRDVVGYLHDYPDQVHHPTENLLFEKVVLRNPDTREPAARLSGEHEAIADETQRILNLLDRLIERPDAETESRVREACRAFAARQQAHMQFENSELFPVAIESLKPADWREIEVHFVASEDPLFGRVVARRHRLLYEYLLGPADRAESQLTGMQWLGMERMLLSGDCLEQGVRAGVDRIKDLQREMLHESRSALLGVVRPKSLGSVAFLPARYSLNMARSIAGCSADLGRIWVGTVADTVRALAGGRVRQ